MRGQHCWEYPVPREVKMVYLCAWKPLEGCPQYHPQTTVLTIEVVAGADSDEADDSWEEGPLFGETV